MILEPLAPRVKHLVSTIGHRQMVSDRDARGHLKIEGKHQKYLGKDAQGCQTGQESILIVLLQLGAIHILAVQMRIHGTGIRGQSTLQEEYIIHQRVDNLLARGQHGPVSEFQHGMEELLEKVDRGVG